MTPPLAGVRILDLTRVWSGPLATRMLADLGADVIKVEAPTARGPSRPAPFDPNRGSFYPNDEPGVDPWNRSVAFNKLNRNKRSLTLDLTQPEATRIFLRLVESADAVIENYSPRVMGNLGLDFEALAAVNQRIVLISMPGYGRDGPMRDGVAYGTTLDAESGAASLMGYHDRGPQRLGVAFPDHVAAVHAAGAVLTALLQRDATGHGQHVDLSQLESMVTLVGDRVVGYQLSGELPKRDGNRHAWIAPHGAFPCREPNTWIDVGIASDQQWAAFVALIGQPSLAIDPRFATVPARLRHQSEAEAIVATWTASQDAHEAMLLLQSRGIAAGAVHSAKGVHEDPHLRARGFFVSLTHPSAGTHDYPGLPMRFSETPPVFAADAPRLGEHNRELLQGLLGYDDAAFDALMAAGVIADRPPV